MRRWSIGDSRASASGSPSGSAGIASRPSLCSLVLAIALVVVGQAQGCPQRASPAYTAQVERALRAGTDVWGTGTPSYARLVRHLHPLRFALGRGGTKLTASGVYYLPFAVPAGPHVMLHVADGSQLIARRVGGPSVIVSVGGRRFESCGAKLADGWLPILRDRRSRLPAGVLRPRAARATSGVDGPRIRIGTLARLRHASTRAGRADGPSGSTRRPTTPPARAVVDVLAPAARRAARRSSSRTRASRTRSARCSSRTCR